MTLAVVCSLFLAGGVAVGAEPPPVPPDGQVERLPDPLRLEQVLQLARERRAEIVAARARARAAAQQPAIVSALEDPMVFPSVDHLPFMLGGMDVSLTVEQRFPLSGIRGNRRRAAEAEVERLRAMVGTTELDVELDATNALLMLRERRQTARILVEQRVLAQQLSKTALARFSTGTAGHAEALRAEVEVARLEGALRSIAAEVRAAEAMLNVALARPTDAMIPTIDESEMDLAPPPRDAAREAARARRPELQAGRAEVIRAEAEVAVMESMYSPMAMVRTGPAYTMSDGAGWMLMVGVSVPLWRGRLDAGAAEAVAMTNMSRADLQAMSQMVDGEAAVALELVVAARERVLSLREEVLPRAIQAIDPTLAEYGSGQLPLASVLDAFSALWSAQADLVSAEYGLGVAHARLRRATGERSRP